MEIMEAKSGVEKKYILMKDYSIVKTALLDQQLLPLFFHQDLSVSKEVLKSLYRAGVRITEYANRGKEAFENYQELLKLRDAEMPDLLLGVGTVKDLATAQKFLGAGADFLISPNTDLDLIRFCAVHGVFHTPGCMTPTEIAAAEGAGAQFIKLFPGNLLGPAFVSSVKDIFPSLHFMPTGGVDPDKESISLWFKSGVAAVGMGSKLISRKSMDQADFAGIEQSTKNVLSIIHQIVKNAF